MQVDAALPSGVNFEPAERARMVKDSLDVCQKKASSDPGIPKVHHDVHREFEGTLCLLPVCGGQLHPDVPHAGWRRLGMANLTGIKTSA